MKQITTKQITTKQIIQDCFLIEFWEKINKESLIVGKEEIIKWSEYFSMNRYEGIPCIQNSDSFPCNITPLSFEWMGVVNEDCIQLILQLSNKISFCGPSFFPTKECMLDLYNFYFCSCTVEEVKDLLLKSIDILEKYVKEDLEAPIIYSIRGDNIIVITLGEHETIREITFHCAIFKNKGEMLRNIGPSIYQQGYCKDGYFSTISGGITAAMSAFPLDTNFRELTYECMPEIGIDILFHGITEDLEEGDEIKLLNGKICHEGFSSFDINYIGPKYQGINIKDFSPNLYIYNEVIKRSTNVVEWIDNYQPFIVGISDDRYVSFSNVKRKFSLNDDIFRLLCYYWLQQEMLDAKERILNL